MKCPHCQNEDPSMIEFLYQLLADKKKKYLCSVCGKVFYVDIEGDK